MPSQFVTEYVRIMTNGRTDRVMGGWTERRGMGRKRKEGDDVYSYDYLK